MIIFLIYSIITGFLLNFAIHLYYKNKVTTKNLFFLNNLNNKKLSILIIILNFIIYLISYKTLANINYCFICCSLFSLLIFLNITTFNEHKISYITFLLILILSILAINATCKNIFYHIIGSFTISIPFLFICLLLNNFDILNFKLFFMLGLFLGSLHIIILVCLCFIFIGIELILKHLIFNKKNKEFTIPLSFYISISTFISILYGDKILDWYFIRVFLL